eukprot:m51a1_g14748 hypothetical protein (288) ;mRNA; r:312105-313029
MIGVLRNYEAVESTVRRQLSMDDEEQFASTRSLLSGLFVCKLTGTEALAVAMADTPCTEHASRRLQALLSHKLTRRALLNEVVRNGVVEMYETVAHNYDATERVGAFLLATKLGRQAMAQAVLLDLNEAPENRVLIGTSYRQELLEAVALSRSQSMLEEYVHDWQLGPSDIYAGAAFRALRAHAESCAPDGLRCLVRSFVLTSPPSPNALVDDLGCSVGANPAATKALLLELARGARQYASAGQTEAESNLRVSRASGFVAKAIEGAKHAGKTCAVLALSSFWASSA